MEVTNTTNSLIERASVFLKTKEGRKEGIKNKRKKEAIVDGVKTALDLLNISETKTVTLYPSDTKTKGKEKTEQVTILIHDNGIKTIVMYPAHGVRIDYNQSTKNLPKNFTVAGAVAEAWAFGKHTAALIAAYIEKEFKKHVRQSRK